MTTSAERVMIGGVVFLDGHPAANQRVLALSADMHHLLGAAVTTDEGRYSMALPSGTDVVLVAKIQGPVLAVASRETRVDRSSSHDFHFDSEAPDFATIRGEIVPAEGAAPPYIGISVTPVHLHGVPPGVEHFFLRQDAGVVDAAFFEMQLRDATFALRVQHGRYRIAGGYINYGRPMMTGAPPPNVIVDRIEADSEREALPGERFGGFTLDVERDRSIRLHLAILPDDQLSPSR